MVALLSRPGENSGNGQMVRHHSMHVNPHVLTSVFQTALRPGLSSCNPPLGSVAVRVGFSLVVLRQIRRFTQLSKRGADVKPAAPPKISSDMTDREMPTAWDGPVSNIVLSWLCSQAIAVARESDA